MYRHHSILHYLPRTKLKQIYISTAIRSFALSMVALFVPLYLYNEMNYSLTQTLMFFIFYSVVFAIATPLAAKFSSLYGLKHSILMSVPFYLGFIFLLYLLPYYNIPLIILASLLGLSLAFYWMGMHLVFYHVSDKKHRGEEIGKQTSYSIIATMFGPAVGGLLIKFSGFNIVFLLTSILLLMSSLVLFISKEKKVKYHFKLSGLFSWKHWENSLFFVSRGARTMALGVVWPLFIFLILKDYFSLGLLESLLALSSAILIWLVGKFSDSRDKKVIIRWTIGFESIAWIIRSLVTSMVQIFGATIFGGIAYGIVAAPIGAVEYDKARRNPTPYFVSREIFICLGRILMLSFVLMTSLKSGLVFQGILSLTALLF